MNIVHNMSSVLKDFLIEPIRLARLQKKYPTCKIYQGATIDAHSRLGNYNVIFKNSAIIESSLGDHTFVQRESVISNCEIGKFCSIAMRVNVGLAQHAITYVSSHPAFYLSSSPIVCKFSRIDRFTPFKQTHIGNDVWIGQNALVMGGIAVGTGAIIAAGAVVTKDVPEYAIVGGVPAKIIRYRFNKEMRNKLIETRWWDMPSDWLHTHHELFLDPGALVAACERKKAENFNNE